jgi:hypothetical protein
MAKEQVSPEPKNLVSALQGLYARVASRLDIDPSYVSRVARGERESKEIVGALDREMRQIMKVLKFNRNGSGRKAPNQNGASQNGVGRRRIKKTERAA